jgi:Coenzyme PQQ synthesis protein D (PqqD)
MSLEPTNKPKQKTDYRLETLDDEILLYHPSETKIMYLNPTASIIWGLCNGERTTQEIISLLQDAYPESAAEISADVETTLEQFIEHGCIEFD